MSTLNTLKLVASKKHTTVSPVVHRRNKLATKIHEQLELCEAKKQGQNYAPKKPKQTKRERTEKNVACQRTRSIERKLKFIKILGGCCSKCGYNKNWAVLEFHHRNPNQKEIQLSLERIGHIAEKKLLLEVKKCDLLCANCHRELHNPDKII